MLLPITHEDMTARRWPFATTAIIGLCVVVFLALMGPEREGAEAVEDAASQAAAYWQEHPYLEAQPPLDRLVSHAAVAPKSSVSSRLRGSAFLRLPDEDVRASQQRVLDALTANLRASLDQLPFHRFGYVPAENNWAGLVTSQFLHAGWLHLIFNMWFLWLCGCNLEDRWGWHVFVPFYLLGGIAAGLAHKLAFPDSSIPTVGASGAIAAAMGAFLVSFARTRIRFLYFYFLVRPGTFTAPAYFMLPLWLTQEVVSGLAEAKGAGVAHWAHVGGFVYGVVVALVLRATGWEARLDAAVERAVSVEQDARIMRAAEWTNAGRAGEALALLGELARERPEDIDVQLEMLRAGRAAGDRTAEARAYASLVKLYVGQGLLDTAYDLLAEAERAGLDAQVSSELRLRFADRCVVAGRLDLAWTLYDAMTRRGLGDPIAVKAALAQAKVAQRLGRGPEHRRLLEAVLQSPFSTVEIDESARAALAAADVVGAADAS